MKKQFLIATLILFHLSVNAQSKSAAFSEFTRCAKYEFKYGNVNFTHMVYRSFSAEGMRIPEINVSIETLKPNTKIFFKVLDVVWDYCKNNRDFLFANLHAMHISAINSK